MRATGPWASIFRMISRHASLFGSLDLASTDASLTARGKMSSNWDWKTSVGSPIASAMVLKSDRSISGLHFALAPLRSKMDSALLVRSDCEVQ